MERYEQNEIQPELGNFRPNESLLHRRRLLHILFIHCDAKRINECLRELKRGGFAVNFDSVVDSEQCVEPSLSKCDDIIVMEYPSPCCDGAEGLQTLQQYAHGIPVVLLIAVHAAEIIAELTPQNTFEYVEREHLGQLPMAVRRALNDKQLREELEEVRKALVHSQSLYRALAGR